MKLLSVLVLIFLTSISFLFAQSVKTDSTVFKTKIATEDAKHFKLDKQIWQANRKAGFDPTSDYFKPNTTNAAHPEWLTDSVYVKAYRNAAYRKNLKRRTTGHYFLVGGGIYVAALGVGLIIFIAVYASGGLK